MLMFKFFVVSLTLLILYGIKSIETNIFTSVAEVGELLDTESVLIYNLEGYLLDQKRKIDHLKLKVQKFKRKLEISGANASNPFNIYLLKDRLTSDWKILEDLMFHVIERSFFENNTNYRNILKFPTEEDFNGAVMGILGLQSIYKLDTANVANGKLNGVQYSTEMTSSDCLAISQYSLKNKFYNYGITWMKEALHRSAYGGNLEIDYEQKEKFVNKKVLRNTKGDDGSFNIAVSKIPIKITEFHTSDLSEFTIYGMMCRDELIPTPSQLRPLRCHYVTNNVPFLKIAPLKRETASMSPFVVIYHDVMYDNEIELVKEMAKPLLTPAGVEGSSDRNAKRACIKTDEHKIIQNIIQRTEDMTGLNMETAESLEVVNYGIGGHYVPHYDFYTKEEKNAFKNIGTGNRIATVLFYMSDVKQGGATVFHTTKTSILPKKGAAVFWYNLYASGERDYRTRHAACPVIFGSKWVSNLWIHEYGQEFRRQCNLMPDHVTYLGK